MVYADSMGVWKVKGMEQVIIMLIITGMAFLAGYATGYCTGVERKDKK